MKAIPGNKCPKAFKFIGPCVTHSYPDIIIIIGRPDHYIH